MRWRPPACVPLIAGALAWALGVEASGPAGSLPARGGGDGVPGRATDSPPAVASAHWAYQPVRRVSLPAVHDSSWPEGSIDRFVLAALEERGLRPVADADRAALGRRLHFDLTGLPPAPDELDAFVSDTRPGALAAWVDRLLASPRFGEHWARHWFDIVRYAESVTLRGLIFREAWRYRDYVIDVFNRDVPLDLFIREQIAGDLLAAEGVEERRRRDIATAFLMLGNTNLEEQDKGQLEMDVVDEQLEVLGKAFLGQTVSCARCHDHKFDPIPTADYYAMAGILKNIVTLEHANVSAWVERPLPLEPDQEAAFRGREAAIAELEARIQALRQDLAVPVVDAGSLAGIVVDDAQARPVGAWQHSTHTRPFIGDGYLHDQDQGKGTKTLTFPFDLPPSGSYEVRFAYTPGANRAADVPITVFHAGGETVVSVNQQVPPPVDGRFVSLGIFRFETNGFAHVLIATGGTRGHVVADAVQLLPVTGTRAEPGAAIAEAGPAGPLSSDTALPELEARLKELRGTSPKRPKVMAPREATAIVDLPIHRRGSVHALGERVPRGFLSVARVASSPVPPGNASGRVELADWITRPDNPLTARVQVNRLWLWLMGEGLVRTPDNFGTTGDAPTHPELLDWLTLRFVTPRSAGGLGWSTKALIREIVLSRTYRLSTTPSGELREADPDNRLWGRAHRKRLSAEQLRDAMLAAAGTLRLDPPGGPTYPVSRASDYGFVSQDTRRSVYLPVFRNALPAMFETFDFPSPSMVVGRRDVSTVPTQALFLLNHPFVRDQARACARRLLASAGGEGAGAETDPQEAHVERLLGGAYRLLLGRPPAAPEARALRVSLGAQPAAEETWIDVVHALLASVEFRYLD